MKTPFNPTPLITDSILRAAGEIYFDGREFWHRHTTNRWESLSPESATRLLRVDYKLSGKRPENKASQIDKALRWAQVNHRIVAGAPFVHDKRDIIEYRSGSYLNTSTVKPIQPAEKDDPTKRPWLSEFFENIWEEPEDTQRDHYLAWFQRFYSSALNGKMLPGQHVIYAGVKGQGKTLTSRQIIGAALGGTASGANFLKGKTEFNSELAKFAVWVMDDEDGTFTWEQRVSFSNSLKSTAANQEIRCEPKFANAYTIPWCGRNYLTCNLDARSLKIMPDMRGGLDDKLMLFRGGSWKPTFLEKEANEQRIKDELPYFLRWLLDWKPPQYVLSNEPRYGVKSYHHPSLMEAAEATSSETRLSELLGEWRKEALPEDKWMTVTLLRKELSMDPSMRAQLTEFSRDRMREALEELGPEFVKGSRTHCGNRQYLICKGSADSQK